MRMLKHVDLRYRRKGSEIYPPWNLSDAHSEGGCFFEISFGRVKKQPHEGIPSKKRLFQVVEFFLTPSPAQTELPAEEGFQQRMENWEGERNGTWLAYESFYLFALHLDK